jgi:hypothetical protein
MIAGLPSTAKHCKWSIQTVETLRAGMHTKLKTSGLVGSDIMLHSIAAEAGATTWQNAVSRADGTVQQRIIMAECPRITQAETAAIQHDDLHHMYTVVFRDTKQIIRLLQTAANRATATWHIDRSGHSEMLPQDIEGFWLDSEHKQDTPAIEKEPTVDEPPPPVSLPPMPRPPPDDVMPILRKLAEDDKVVRAALYSRAQDIATRGSFKAAVSTQTLNDWVVPPELANNTKASTVLLNMLNGVEFSTPGSAAQASMQHPKDLLAESIAAQSIKAAEEAIAEPLKPPHPGKDTQSVRAEVGSSTGAKKGKKPSVIYVDDMQTLEAEAH